MTLNMDRVRLQQAVAVGLGMQAAHSDEPLDESWGDAIAADPTEGAELVYQANVERARARNRRKAGPMG